MGSTDVAIAIASGKNWFRFPETFRINVDGEFKKGAYPKDLILWITGKLGVDRATYKALEFHGDGIDKTDMDGELTIANMEKPMLTFSLEK